MVSISVYEFLTPSFKLVCHTDSCFFSRRRLPARLPKLDLRLLSLFISWILLLLNLSHFPFPISPFNFLNRNITQISGEKNYTQLVMIFSVSLGWVLISSTGKIVMQMKLHVPCFSTVYFPYWSIHANKKRVASENKLCRFWWVFVEILYIWI